MNEGPTYKLGDLEGLDAFRDAAYRWGQQQAAQEDSPISEDNVLDYMDRFVEPEDVDDWELARREFRDAFYMGWDTYYQQNIT